MEHNQQQISLDLPESVRNHERGQYAMVFSLLVILALLTISVWLQHRNAVEKTIQQTRNLTQVLSLQLEAEFDRVEGVLHFVEYMLQTMPREHRTFATGNRTKQQELMKDRLRILKNSFDGIEAINYFDNGGNLIFSSKPQAESANIADRPHFQLFKANPQITRTFSDIITARTTGLRSLAQTRAVRDDHGNMLGLVSALIPMEWIDSKLAGIDTGEGGVVLLRNSETTVLLSRFPRYNEADFNQPLPVDNPIRRRIDGGERAGELKYTASTDAETRLGSFQRLTNYPFYFQAAMAEAHYLEGWRQYARVVTLITLLLMVTFALILWRMTRIQAAQQQAVTSLAASELKFRSLFNKSQDEIYLHNVDGNILDVNPAATAGSGYSHEQLLTMSVYDLWPDDSGKDEITSQWRSWAVGEGTHLEYQHVKADGSRYYVDIITNKIDYDNKQLILAILRDITSRKNDEKALQNSARSLQRNNADLLRLGEVMAHHFQESTRRMATLARMVHNHPCADTDPDSRQALLYIDEQANRLSQLVRRVQRYLELDESAPGITVATAVRALIHQTLASSAAVDADLHIATDLPDLPLPVARLRRILSIVFNNIGHYRRDEVPVTIQVSVVDEHDNLELHIADNGSGIDPAHREQVLELFTNLAPGKNTGSGLALARRIMRLAGGDLRLEDGIDGGIAVVLTFGG